MCDSYVHYICNSTVTFCFEKFSYFSGQTFGFKIISVNITMDYNLPSVLWCCWLGSRKGIQPVKNEWLGAGVVICLKRGADLHLAQLMLLPLTVSCFSKIQIYFYLSGTGLPR